MKKKIIIGAFALGLGLFAYADGGTVNELKPKGVLHISNGTSGTSAGLEYMNCNGLGDERCAYYN